MPKIKTHRSAPSLDMTPMVDLAFLLVTFFMLISQFQPEEMVTVTTPSSRSQIKIPESNVITLTVDKEGRVFFGVDGKNTKAELLDKMAAKYNVSFSEQERAKFSNLSSFGVPVNQLKSLLALPKEQLKKANQPGVPMDSLNNELGNWVHQTRMANPQTVIAIKGDENSDIPTIKRVIKTLQDYKVNRFNLITSQEGGPSTI